MKFYDIYKNSFEKAKEAVLSLWTRGDHPMRKYFIQMLDRDGMLAEPVFQSAFSWEHTPNDDWENCFSDTDMVIKFKAAGEFKYTPYKHQAESWKHLTNSRETESIVVTSGTGSGKTECFMFPVLHDLYVNKKNGEDNGAIQAIFLYPLNALMNDQRERLAKLCYTLGLNYAVYNGSTPEHDKDVDIPVYERTENTKYFKSEIKSRDAIRDADTTPQILLTNPSMMEFILVRPDDQPIIDRSKGKLKWIVIDEAHSYSGSSAVELCYQIRRILDAFGMDIKDVHFACTSATIGGTDDAKNLQKFISDLTGQSQDKIHVIGGKREVPKVSDTTVSDVLKKANLNLDAKRITNLRNYINSSDAVSLQEIWKMANGTIKDYRVDNALNMVDQLCDLNCVTDDGVETTLFSLRAHFFMRMIDGLYACTNPNCSCADKEKSPLGYLSSFNRTTCPKCEHTMLELVQCKNCSEIMIQGESHRDTHEVRPFFCTNDAKDYFAIEEDDNEIEDVLESDDKDKGWRRFVIGTRAKLLYPNMNLSKNRWKQDENKTLLIPVSDGNINEVVRVEGANIDHMCVECNKLMSTVNTKHFRLPVDFMNQVIAPALLGQTAGENAEWGKYIVFTDSRQGTAISAKVFNIDEERNIMRAGLMHYWADKRDRLTLYDVYEQIYNKKLFEHISGLSNTDGLYHTEENGYRAALLRGFIGRRTLKEICIENLGFVKLVYRDMQTIELPDILRDTQKADGSEFSQKDWQDFIKICLDYVVRLGNHIQPYEGEEYKYVRNGSKGVPIFPSPYVESHPGKGLKGWPTINENDVNQNRLVLLLCAALEIKTVDELHKDNNTRKIKELLDIAWHDCCRFLTKVPKNCEGYNSADVANSIENAESGYYLDLSKNSNVCVVSRNEQVWYCPVTRVMLDTIFCGISPSISGSLCPENTERFRVTKRYEVPYADGVNQADKQALINWINSDHRVLKLKEEGVWNNRCEPSFTYISPYVAAEHSAQQSSDLLTKYVNEFKKNELNILHCSTTMEMGVDIGDVSLVLMDTVPPTSASYMQRAGRAGRSGQNKAVAFSMCNGSPIGTKAFNNPKWAIEASNAMNMVKPSINIIQRHINSYYFHKFIVDRRALVSVSSRSSEFFEGDNSICENFISYLEECRQNTKGEELAFKKVFPNQKFESISQTIAKICEIKKKYDSVCDEINKEIQKITEAINEAKRNKKKSDEIFLSRQMVAISCQLVSFERSPLLIFLSTEQFIPNANMPSDVVEFDCMDKKSLDDLIEKKKLRDKLSDQIDTADDAVIKEKLKEKRDGVYRDIAKIRRNTTISREARTALNEYAPGQTIVVNEANFVSVGMKFYGEYDQATKRRYLYFCNHCGNTVYSLQPLSEDKLTCTCRYNDEDGNSVNGRLASLIAIDRRLAETNGYSSYTKAYEPYAFRTDAFLPKKHREMTFKKYYDIQPALIDIDWNNERNVHMVNVIQKEEGEILLYNMGAGFGFAVCKKCGRASIDVASINDANMPESVRRGHKNQYGMVCQCNGSGMNNADVDRHSVITAKHVTSYAVLKLQKTDNISDGFVDDEETIYSLGVIIKRALVDYLHINDNEIDFGVKQREDCRLLFFYDTNKGGCGYSNHLYDINDCEQIMMHAYNLICDYSCSCEDQDKACCSNCLIDHNTHFYEHKLSKKKAMDWLALQVGKKHEVPDNIKAMSPNAKSMYSDLQQTLYHAVNNRNVSEITICSSAKDDDIILDDFSMHSRHMGSLIQKALNQGKVVNIDLAYDVDTLDNIEDTFLLIKLKERMSECNVKLVKTLGEKTSALIVKDEIGEHHYFVGMDGCLPYNENWGDETSIYKDEIMPSFVEQEFPDHNSLKKFFDKGEFIREGKLKNLIYNVADFYEDAIVNQLLEDGDEEKIRAKLQGKRVTLFLNDAYLSSPLACDLFVYMVKSMMDKYGFSISGISMSIKNSRINWENNATVSDAFYNERDRDNYLNQRCFSILGLRPTSSNNITSHCRGLNFIIAGGGSVEIRPDYGFGGGWCSDIESHELQNLASNDISFEAKRIERYDTYQNIVYYVIVK